MKHIENYKSFIFKPKIGTYWFINGNAKDVTDTLNVLLSKHLNDDDIDNMKKLISKIEYYLNINSIGFFIYYSRFGFSYSIIEDINQMIDLYKTQKKEKIYEYIGELKISNNQIIFDNKNKKFLEYTIRYNL